MKKQALAVAVALLLSAIASGVCYAQQPTLAVHIPFAFQVGDKTLPAGEYRIEDQICEHIECGGKMLVENLNVEADRFFACEGVKIAADRVNFTGDTLG